MGEAVVAIHDDDGGVGLGRRTEGWGAPRTCGWKWGLTRRGRYGWQQIMRGFDKKLRVAPLLSSTHACEVPPK